MIEISVVIPVYKGRNWIEDCLSSMAGQSYSYNLFEIILIFNGPNDGSLDIAEKFIKQNELMNFQICHNDRANASAARNVGALNARGNYVTWVDVDDWISAEYLELLAMSMAEKIVPFAQIVNVDSNGVHQINNAINSDLFSKKTPKIHPSDFVRAMTFMTAKLLPASWVRQIPFRENLRSGEDVAFYGELMAKFEFELSLMPAAAGATYFRRVTATSVSRGNETRDFLVSQRADVIEALSESCLVANKRVRGSLEQMMRSQASFIRRYLQNHTEEKTDVMDELVARRIDNFPWGAIQDAPRQLVVAYNFAPYNDTGAVVASKRIRDLGQTVDVISNNMSRVRDRNEENRLLSAPYVARHHEIKSPSYFASDLGIESFVSDGLAVYEKWVKSGRNYESIYSRSMWPASHFLAAAIKIQNPTLDWIAEFSDPSRVSTTGEFRSTPISTDALRKNFAEQIPAVYLSILEEYREIFYWTELLPYIFADKIVFTNENQMNVMLGYAPQKLVEIIQNKSTVQHQPTLPRRYYLLNETELKSVVDEINIGYFGEFYNTRGLSEIIEALEMLPEFQLNKIRLWIFSANSSTLKSSISNRVASRVTFKSKVKYLEFLGLLDQFDCLMVNDALTADHHAVNPYLPSKFSDYKGSTSDIWAIVEPGSVLSTMDVEHQSIIGDTLGAFQCLNSIILQKYSNLA